MDFDLIYHNILTWSKKSIVLWGGKKETLDARTFLRKKGLIVEFIVDNNVSECEGEKIYNPEMINGMAMKYYVVVLVPYYKSIEKQLVEFGYTKTDYYYLKPIMRDGVKIDCNNNIIIGDSELEVIFHGSDSIVNVGMPSKQSGIMHIWSGTRVTISEMVEMEDVYIRIGNNSNVHIGKNTTLKKHFTMHAWDEINVHIGENVSVAHDAYFSIDSYTSVVIGNMCTFSYYIILKTNDGHSIFDVMSKRNINSTKEIAKNRKIVIGNHVWIGMRTTILYNTTIGDGSIVGACSMVKSKISNNSLCAGVPAKILKENIAWSREDAVECIPDDELVYCNLTES